jgi:hypothetical protein
LPNDPYEFCLERCLEQVTKRVYSAPPDNGVNIFYDNQKQFGRITGRLLRWHKKTFEPNRLSEFRQRQIDLQFIPSSRDAPGFAVPDILAFECCEYLRANTGIPFLGAKLMSGPTPEPRPIVTKFFESKRPALAVVKTYTEWFLDFDLSNDAV